MPAKAYSSHGTLLGQYMRVHTGIIQAEYPTFHSKKETTKKVLWLTPLLGIDELVFQESRPTRWVQTSKLIQG
jgi:hypothetical protein